MHAITLLLKRSSFIVLCSAALSLSPSVTQADFTTTSVNDHIAAPNSINTTNELIAAILGKPAALRKQIAAQALTSAEQRLTSTPHDINAHLLKVMAMGTIARTLTSGESIKQRYGSRSKKAVEEMLKIAPDHPTAMALSGIWHIEVERRGGGLGALLLDASFAQGQAQLETALRASSTSYVIPFAYAIVLTAYDATKHGMHAQSLLQTALTNIETQQEALATSIKASSNQLLSLIQQQKWQEAGVLARNLM